MKVSSFIGLCVATFVAVGCSSAQKASEVQSVRVPVAPYLNMDCKELATEMSRASRDAEQVRMQVDASYQSDKTKEAVAWILFAPAALFMEGNQSEAGRLAALKGQIEAIREAQNINKCTY